MLLLNVLIVLALSFIRICTGENC